MNTIELSCRQSERLLEMCKYLFPEYKEINVYLVDTEFPEDNNIQTINFWDGINYGKSIHWFEFCITKLYNEFKRKAIDIDLYFFTLNPEHCQWPKEYNHPIDYLYFKF